jgi:N-acetylneuraminic acid mutarotase
VDGKIYAIGGTPNTWDPPLATVEMYDPETDSWTRKADMPTARESLTTSAVNGKIFAVGGAVSTGFEQQDVLMTVEEYDPAANTWSAKTSLHRPKGFHTATVLDDKIYVIGGWTPYEEMYDPATDTWTKLTVQPVVVTGSSAGAIDGKIYIFGGVDEWAGAGSSHIQVYNPEADSWELIAPMPYSAAWPAYSVSDGKVYLLGGTSSEYPVYPPHLDEVWSYSPGENDS